MQTYNDKFYGKTSQNNSRYQSAVELLKIYFNIFHSKKIIDVGCGRGSWLEASQNFGANYLVGIDGDWNNGKISNNVKFMPLNLQDISKKFVYENDLINKFDLCISVETLEHIQKKYSENFIESLCNLSDNILFSAAFIGQGGVNHVNENLHSNWAKIFKQYGYSPFDIFRPSIWNNEKISYWYRQNCFLYVKKNSPNYEYLSKKFSVIENYSFMDCVHPAMYEKKINKPIREILKDLLIKVKKKFFS